MPENRIEVDIRANTAQARQAVEGLSADLNRLKAQAPSPETLLGASGTRYRVDPQTGRLQVLGRNLLEVTGATNELSEATGRAGINVGAMMERMATRLVIFEAIRLAIQGAKAAWDEFSKQEQARIQFEASSTSIEHLEARFNMLRESASKALMPIDQAEKLRETLIDLGATEDQTVWLTRELGQWSHVLGIDSERLATALGHVAQGEGSLQEMRLVTRMMGDQREAGVQLIDTYVSLQRAQKNLEAENKTLEQSMQAVVRSAEQMSEDVNRTRSRSAEFLKQTGILQQITPQLPAAAAGAWWRYTPPAGMSEANMRKLDQQVRDYITQYQAGLAELQKRYGYPATGEQRQLAALYGIQQPALSPDYVLRVGKEAQDDQLRQLRQTEQADREHRARQAEGLSIQTQAAKAQIATLPQAVGAPPPEIWNEWKGSLDGIATQAKENTNEMVKAIWDSTKPLATAMDKAATANENVYNLLSGSGGT